MPSFQYKNNVLVRDISKFKDENFTFTFRLYFPLNESHEIARRNAGPISATNLCINECTGVADNWTDFSVSGIKVDGELFNFSNAKVFTS